MGLLPTPAGREHGELVRGELGSIALESGVFASMPWERVMMPWWFGSRSARKRGTVVLLTNMDTIREVAAQAMLSDGWTAQEDLDRVIQDCLREEGDDTVADDVKKGMIPVMLVAKAMEEERAFIDKIGVFDVEDRASARGRRIIKTRWVVTTKCTADAPNVRARWVAQEFQALGRTGPRRVPRADTRAGHGETMRVLPNGASGRVTTSSQLCSTYAGPTSTSNPRTTPPLSCPITATSGLERGSVASSSGACMERARLPGRGCGRSWRAGIKLADLKIGEMSECTFHWGCWKLVGTMHGDDVLISGPRGGIVEKVHKSTRKRYETREQMISGWEAETKQLAILNRKVQW